MKKLYSILKIVFILSTYVAFFISCDDLGYPGEVECSDVEKKHSWEWNPSSPWIGVDSIFTLSNKRHLYWIMNLEDICRSKEFYVTGIMRIEKPIIEGLNTKIRVSLSNSESYSFYLEDPVVDPNDKTIMFTETKAIKYDGSRKDPISIEVEVDVWFNLEDPENTTSEDDYFFNTIEFVRLFIYYHPVIR